MKRTGLIMVLIGLFLFVQVSQADWTSAKRLTWTSGASVEPAIAGDSSGNLYVVWVDDTPGNEEIYYKKSTDGGSTWTANKRLTWTSGASSGPEIAVDASSNLHVVWNESMPAGVKIYYKKSTDGGTTWTQAKRLTWTSYDSYGPAIAVDSSKNLHVVWNESMPADDEIYYKKSTDGGTTWTPAKRLTWKILSDAYDPAIAADSSNNLHVVWDEIMTASGEIYYKKSTDGGGTWTSSQRLTWNGGGLIRESGHCR